MSIIEQKQRAFELVSRYLIGKLAIIFTGIALSSSVYAAQLDCRLVSEYENVNVDIRQSTLSEYIFGVVRKEQEMRLITRLTNEIYQGHTSFDGYLSLKDCVGNSGSHFIQRNRNVILTTLLSQVTSFSDVAPASLEIERSFAETVLRQGDNYEQTGAIGAVKRFRDDRAVDALFELIVTTERRSYVRIALSSIHSIKSDYAQQKLIKAKEIRPEFESVIDEYLNYW
ncbi:hypothetical protein ACED47_21380 [Vibrio splendidus]|uniref:hypothetical protein n=1 Tax=Vibrio splendidus TaxID=29497 RepID=UPI00352D0E90